MNDYTKIQASIIAALFGFFVGGMININREIIDIFLSAIIGGIIVFLIIFFILNIYYRKESKKIEYDNNNKGKKVDITINDTDDLINNYLNK